MVFFSNITLTNAYFFIRCLYYSHDELWFFVSLSVAYFISFSFPFLHFIFHFPVYVVFKSGVEGKKEHTLEALVYFSVFSRFFLISLSWIFIQLVK